MQGKSNFSTFKFSKLLSAAAIATISITAISLKPLPAQAQVNTQTQLPTSSTSDHQASINALQATLTELQALQLQTKQAHWNVSGTLYYPLHEMLQEHYEKISKDADMVAERLLSIGASSDGRAPTIVQTSTLPEIPGGFIDDAQVLTFFINQYERVGERLYDRIKAVEDADPTSANILQEVEGDIEVYQWQVRAEFQPTPTDPNNGVDINNNQPVRIPDSVR
ncbi:MAG: DNA starvation/stationary phase protection protein [Phormidesmis sp.]